MSLSVDYNGVGVEFDESDVTEVLTEIDCYDSEVEILGYDTDGNEYSAIGCVSCDELVEVYEDSVWPVEGESFGVPEDDDDVLVLESVGSCIDEDGTVYTMNIDGTPDTNCGVDWIDTSDEWSESLSEDDCGLLNDWLLENNYSVDVNDPDDGSWEGR